MASAEQIRRAIQAEAAPVKGEWTGVVKKTKPDGVPKPRGRAPLGATWDYDKGEWVGGTKPALKNATSAPRARQKTQRLSDLVDAGKTYAKPKKNALSEAPTPEKSPTKKRRIRPKALKPPRKAAGGAAARPFVPDEDDAELVAYGPVARRFHADDDSEDSEVAAITNRFQPPKPPKRKKEKRRGPPLDSLSSLPPPGTKKAPQRVKPRPFLDTKRCTQPPGPRIYKKRPPKPDLVVEKVEAFSGRVLYATDDESVGSKKGEHTDDEDAKSTGSLDDWIVADDACVAEDPGFSAEARWATEGAGLLRELHTRPLDWRKGYRPATPPPAPSKVAPAAFHASPGGATTAAVTTNPAAAPKKFVGW